MTIWVPHMWRQATLANILSLVLFLAFFSNSSALSSCGNESDGAPDSRIPKALREKDSIAIQRSFERYRFEVRPETASQFHVLDQNETSMRATQGALPYRSPNELLVALTDHEIMTLGNLSFRHLGGNRRIVENGEPVFRHKLENREQDPRLKDLVEVTSETIYYKGRTSDYDIVTHSFSREETYFDTPDLQLKKLGISVAWIRLSLAERNPAVPENVVYQRLRVRDFAASQKGQRNYEIELSPEAERAEVAKEIVSLFKLGASTVTPHISFSIRAKRLLMEFYSENEFYPMGHLTLQTVEAQNHRTGQESKYRTEIQIDIEAQTAKAQAVLAKEAALVREGITFLQNEIPGARFLEPLQEVEYVYGRPFEHNTKLREFREFYVYERNGESNNYRIGVVHPTDPESPRLLYQTRDKILEGLIKTSGKQLLISVGTEWVPFAERVDGKRLEFGAFDVETSRHFYAKEPAFPYRLLNETPASITINQRIPWEIELNWEQ